MLLIHCYLLTIILNTIGFSLLFLLIPVIREDLINEGQLIENLTAIICLSSFILGLIFIVKNKKYNQKLYLSLPVLGLIFFLEEISFGYEILNFQPPLIGGVRIDAAHDLINLLFYKVKDLSELKILLLTIFSVITLFYLFIAYRKRVLRYLNGYGKIIFDQNYPYFYLIGSLFFWSASLFLDLHIIDFDGMKFVEELLEMNGSLSLFFACFAIRNDRQVSL